MELRDVLAALKNEELQIELAAIRDALALHRRLSTHTGRRGGALLAAPANDALARLAWLFYASAEQDDRTVVDELPDVFSWQRQLPASGALQAFLTRQVIALLRFNFHRQVVDELWT